MDRTRTISALRGMPLMPDDRVGIEVELEHVFRPTHVPGWHVKDDGSLRNGGAEFVTEPTPYRHAVEYVRMLWDEIPERRWTGGMRCGVHVHLNMLGYTPARVARVLAVYALLEPAVFELCGQAREQNIYCVPWYRALEQVDLVVDSFRQDLGYLRQTCKYTAMYAEPLLRFGTIEFRSAPVFPRVEDMLGYLRFVRGIRNAADMTGDADLLYIAPERLLRMAEYPGNIAAAVDKIEELDTVNIAARFVRTRRNYDWSF